MLKLLAVLAIAVMVSTVDAFDISSTTPGPGEKVTLTGTASPGQDVVFRTSFQLNLPVKSGGYEYEASGVDVPQKPNRVAVTIEGVKDLNVGVKMGIWISKGFKATNGAASISHSDVPPGKYDLKVFGDALDGQKSVSVDVLAETTIKADSAGKYSLSVDTSSMSNGAYKIEGAGETKTIKVGGREPPSDSGSSGQSGSADEMPDVTRPESGGIGITPDVVTWYAGHVGLDPKNQEQYSKAEQGLNNMTTGGYWKIIATGDPLTEKAGDCQDRYCLVRGKDACTFCRLEEMALSSKAKKTQPIVHSNANKTVNSNAPIKENDNQEGLIQWLLDIIRKVLGF